MRLESILNVLKDTLNLTYYSKDGVIEITHAGCWFTQRIKNVFKIVNRYTFQTVAACCKNTGLTISIYFFCVITAGAQTIPNQKISIDVKDVSLAEVLNEISIKSSLRFSYNPKRMEAERPVSYQAINKSVSEILTDLAGRY